jgi:hypothetical protein
VAWWHQAREAIRQVSHVYLVGYSLPDTDLVTVGLLRENLAPEAQVFVVNRPNKDEREDVATRAKRLLSRDVNSVYPESHEAVKGWAADLAEERSRETPKPLLVDLEREVASHGTSYKVHVNVYPDDGRHRWCVQESGPGQKLNCIDPAQPLIQYNQEPRWQADNFTGALQELSKSGSSFAVLDPDGNKRFVVDAYVSRGLAGPAYDYGVHLQCVRN